jgi:hypothetical protein
MTKAQVKFASQKCRVKHTVPREYAQMVFYRPGSKWMGQQLRHSASKHVKTAVLLKIPCFLPSPPKLRTSTVGGETYMCPSKLLGIIEE